MVKYFREELSDQRLSLFGFKTWSKLQTGIDIVQVVAELSQAVFPILKSAAKKNIHYLLITTFPL